MQKRTKLISIIAILTIVSGVFSIIFSFPTESLLIAVKEGGISKNTEVTIVRVNSNSPAETANLQEGDIIVSVNGEVVSNPTDFTGQIQKNRGILTTIVINRNGYQKSIQLTPRINPPLNEGSVGVEIVTGNKFEPKPIYQVIPEVILNGYSGKEQGPIIYSFVGDSYARLKDLLLGIIHLLIGTGLWKLKKWAFYGFLGLIIIGTLISIYYLFPASLLPDFIPTPFLFNPPSLTDIIFYISLMIVEILAAGYIYKRKNLFQ